MHKQPDNETNGSIRVASNVEFLDPNGPLRLFLVCHPGLEPWLSEELVELGYSNHRIVPGGIELVGHWRDVSHLNIWVRGATRVLVRLAEFSAVHFSQLDKRSRQIAWDAWLPKGSRVAVEATAKRSKLYHSKGIVQRVHQAAEGVLEPTDQDGPTVSVQVRLLNDWCQISLDTSGEALYKRGGKQAVGKAPMRETMAALFLRAAAFSPVQPLHDPMCGSGTFVIEAAQRALGHAAAIKREFAFQDWPSFRKQANAHPLPVAAPLTGNSPPNLLFTGSDRDAGAVQRAEANAQRLQLNQACHFSKAAISDTRPTQNQPGLVIVNPPYGDRLGEKAKLSALYGRFGQTMREHFQGWRVGVITNEPGLANACGLPFQKPGPFVSHGGLKVRLWQTTAL